MLYQVENMFSNMKKMMRLMKKAHYKKNMEIFRAENGKYFQEMTDYVDVAENKEEAAGKIGEVFSEAVYSAFTKNGKMRSHVQVDLNFFMIYYVFPAILLTKDENAVLIADSIRDAWNERNREGNLDYTDYDSLYSKFNEKIFGIF